MKKLGNIDLKLLQLFEEIYRTRNLSRAAKNLDLTQPAVSLALGRLRQHFDDPLFVRTGGVMSPTPTADQLRGMVANAIAMLEATLSYQPHFNPTTDHRLFHIAMTDIGQIVVLPELLNALKALAPNIRVDVVTITSAVPDQLQHGEIDLALGFMPDMEGRFVQENLFEERFACLVGEKHPRIGEVLSAQHYRDEEHVIVTMSGTGHLIIERNLERQGVFRKIAVHIPNFLGLGTIVGNTDLIATLPRRVAVELSHAYNVRIMEPPVSLPTYLVRQHWHERMQHDPAHSWLRRLITSLFREPLQDRPVQGYTRSTRPVSR